MKVILTLIGILVAVTSFTKAALGQIADAPKMIPYAGHLADASGVDLNATVPVEVRLYDSLIAGIGQDVSNSHVLYAESHPSVAVENGNFRIAIGKGVSLNPIWTELPIDQLVSKDAVYLELWIDGERLSPRQRLASTSAVVRAQYAKYADEFSTMPQITEAMLPNYSAKKITSEKFAETSIPNVSASLFSGNLQTGQIPSLPVTKFNQSGKQLSKTMLGALSADRITTGTLEMDRLPENVYLTNENFVIQIQHNVGGEDGTYMPLPEGFTEGECKSIYTPIDSRPVEGIDRIDMWKNSSGVFFCTVNEKTDNDDSDNTRDNCMASALTICKKGGL